MILNAVMCVWNEEDIIESTIKHAFHQGCTNVFIVDNDSTDQTVDIAINAGAKLATIFKTKDFDEDQKIIHLNATVKYINEITTDEKIWWLYIDADEFPNFESKFTILDILKQLDSSVRAIHGYLFDHLPTHQPYHVQGYHPADFQPLCRKTSGSKIPLLRYDKGHPHLWSIGGSHDFISHNVIVPTIKDFLQIHHFPYRNPESTLKRTKILAETRNEWYKKFLTQLHKSNALAYELRYRQLPKIYDENKHRGLKTKKLIYDYKNIIRWYDIYTEKQLALHEYDKFICTAIYFYFIEEYDIALCRFKDAFDICNDEYIKLWLIVKIAECLSHTDNDDTRSIISSITKYNDNELNTYIYNHLDDTINNENNKGSSINDMICKVEFYQSVFPEGIQERYNKMITQIEETIFK